MSLIHKAQTLIGQLIHNLDEADWASRHVNDRIADLPTSLDRARFRSSVSSLSMALNQMGIVRQSVDGALTDYDA